MQILLQYQKNLQEQKQVRLFASSPRTSSDAIVPPPSLDRSSPCLRAQRETQQAEQRLHTHLKQVWADYTRNIEQIQPRERVCQPMRRSAHSNVHATRIASFDCRQRGRIQGDVAIRSRQEDDADREHDAGAMRCCQICETTERRRWRARAAIDSPAREPFVRLPQTIGNDAPIVLAKACEFFVAELSCHSWVHAGKRVTLQVRARARAPQSFAMKCSSPYNSAPPPKRAAANQHRRGCAQERAL